MTPRERKAITNGIWLCANCARTVDGDASGYPAETLHRWKEAAERLAAEEHNHRLPSHEDHKNHLVTLMSGQGNRLFPEAIAITHRATAEALQRLDPRFSVSTSHAEGVTHVAVTPVDSVELTLLIPESGATAWQEGFRQLVVHAQPAILPLEGVAVQGSPLIDEMISPARAAGGYMTVDPPHRQAVLRVHVRVDDRANDFVEQFSGRFFVGQGVMRFEGTGFGELGKLELSICALQESIQVGFEIDFDFSPWQGRSVAQLPHLGRIQLLVGAIEQHRVLMLELDLEGVPMLLQPLPLPSRDMPSMKSLAELLRYTSAANRLSRAIGTDILFQYRNVDEAERCALEGLAALFECGTDYTLRPLPYRLGFRLRVDDERDTVARMLAATGPIDLKMPLAHETFRVFDGDVALPLHSAELLQVTVVRIAASEGQDCHLGEAETAFEFVPTEQSVFRRFVPVPTSPSP